MSHYSEAFHSELFPAEVLRTFAQYALRHEWTMKSRDASSATARLGPTLWARWQEIRVQADTGSQRGSFVQVDVEVPGLFDLGHGRSVARDLKATLSVRQ